MENLFFFIYKVKIIEKEMRKLIDKVKNWKQFLNENVSNNNTDILKESLEIINQRTINIDLFDDELSRRETWELENWSGKKRFNTAELNELNLHFGVVNIVINDYNFNLNFGGFGREKINFKGVVIKYSEYDNEGKKMIYDYFLIKGYIKVNLGNDKGERDVNIKLNSLQEVIKFFNNFENNIKISVD